jgi:hypothetical protein
MKNKFSVCGFWLPVGKANFFRFKEDNKDIRDNDTDLTPTSVFNRLYKVLVRTGHYNYELLEPESRSGYKDTSDPYVAYFISKEPIKNYNIDKLMIRVDSDGYYTFIAYSDNYPLEFDRFREFINNELINGDYYSHSDSSEYFKNNNGILNFFQFNTILSGIYNYNFHPMIFFKPILDKENKKKIEYSLKIFFNKIISHPNKFENYLNSKISELDIKEMESVLKDNSVKIDYFGSDYIRQFVRSTSHCLLKIKWSIETCRRVLLRKCISILHRSEPVEQLENPKDSYNDEIANANENQIKGFILLISSKFPLIKNLQQYIDELRLDKRYEVNFKNINSFINGWVYLINGINSSLNGIENAIEQDRTERMLFELEEIRSEQETQTEITRAQEHIEWESKADNIESTRISSNGVLLALFAVILTFIIYCKPIFVFFLIPEDFGSTFLDVWWQRVIAVAVVSLILYPVIYYSGSILNILFYYTNDFIRDKFSQIYNLINKKRIYYQYEIDARIDSNMLNNISVLDLEYEFEKLLDNKVNKRNSNQNYLLKKIKQIAYRVQRISEDESLHKLHFIGSIKTEEKEKNKNYELRFHMIYEILSHTLSETKNFTLREFRFISSTDKSLVGNQLYELKLFICNEFINKYIDNIIDEREDTIYALLNHKEAIIN